MPRQLDFFINLDDPLEPLTHPDVAVMVLNRVRDHRKRDPDRFCPTRPDCLRWDRSKGCCFTITDNGRGADANTTARSAQMEFVFEFPDRKSTHRSDGAK